MKEKIKIILFLVLTGIAIGVWYWQYQRKQTIMIKFDACLETCPKIGGRLYGSPETKCAESCREKYGITWKEYNEWKE